MHFHTDLREVAAKAGGPAALGAGSHAAHVLLAEDLIAALGVGAPRQVGAALHVASEQGILILREKRRTRSRERKTRRRRGTRGRRGITLTRCIIYIISV